MVSYYDAFAMMAYGAPMSALIDDARRGDIQSYFKAYHVDQTVADIPIFATLHERKKQEADGKFFTAISRRNRTALIPPKLKYPKLWFAFGYLDGLGVLPSREGAGFSLEQLLDLCVSLKIYGASYDRGVEDLSKRLQDYRSLQKRLKARKFNT